MTETRDWYDYENFKLKYYPDKLKRMIHDHKLHLNGEDDISELEKSALNFLIEKCEIISVENSKEENFLCKYDEDLLCLYYAIHRFMETGSREDAFDVYFCYIDIFVEGKYKARKLIEMLSDYENNTSNLVTKHRDHYSHSVYVFVTGLAIYYNNKAYRKYFSGTYYSDISISEKDISYNFLRYWGATSLFHDIGYPFEIPFEQIKTYFNPEMKKDYNDQITYIAYKQMDIFIDLKDLFSEVISKEEKEKITEEDFENLCKQNISKLLEVDIDKIPKKPTIADVIAHHIVRKLERVRFQSGAVNVEEYIKGILLNKPIHPEANDYFMDHALFSSLLLFRRLLEIIGIQKILDDYDGNKTNYYAWMDTLTAIVMHNSLFKYKLNTVYVPSDGGEKLFEENNVPIKAQEHSLAYLLMLCDELQCWDRSSYGKESKKELHAFDCKFEFNEDGTIRAKYLFENDKKAIDFKDGQIESVKNGTFQKFFYRRKKYNEIIKDKIPVYFKIKSEIDLNTKIDSWKVEFDTYAAENCKFIKDIAEIVELKDLTNTEKVGLKVAAQFSDNNRYRLSSLSDVRLISLYNYARLLYEKINNDKNFDCSKIDFEDDKTDSFKGESLAVKISYLQIVKKMAAYLDVIGVFYSDVVKPFSRISLEDVEKNYAEIRTLASFERDREFLECIQMLKCGNRMTHEFFKEISNNNELSRKYVERIIKKNESQENTDDENDYGIPNKNINDLIKCMIDVLLNCCNVYYYPDKKFFSIEKADSIYGYKVVMKDADQNAIKEYTELTVDPKNSSAEVLVEKIQDEESEDSIWIFHVIEFYKKYEYDPDLDVVTGSSVDMIRYFNYDPEQSSFLGLRFEYDATNENYIPVNLKEYHVTFDDGGNVIDRKPVKEFDRLMYYFGVDENGLPDTVFLRNGFEGCAADYEENLI